MAKRSPILGYNHNVRYRGLVFHVQTEDSGVLSPHLFTHLFHGGVIVSTRKLVYDNGSAEDAIKSLMQAQHKAVLKDLKRGHFDDKIDEYLGATPGLLPRGTEDPNAAANGKDKVGDRASESHLARPSEPIVTAENAAPVAVEPEPPGSLAAASGSIALPPVEPARSPFDATDPEIAYPTTEPVPKIDLEAAAPAAPVVTRAQTAERKSAPSAVRSSLTPSAPVPAVAAPVLHAESPAGAVVDASITQSNATTPTLFPDDMVDDADSGPEIEIQLELDEADEAPLARRRTPHDTEQVPPHLQHLGQNVHDQHSRPTVDVSQLSDGIPGLIGGVVAERRAPGESIPPLPPPPAPEKRPSTAVGVASLPPARPITRPPARPAITPPQVVARPLITEDSRGNRRESDAVEVYAPAPPSVEAPPGERPGQYSQHKKVSQRLPSDIVGKPAMPIPSGLGRPGRSPSGAPPPRAATGGQPPPVPRPDPRVVEQARAEAARIEQQRADQQRAEQLRSEAAARVEAARAEAAREHLRAESAATSLHIRDHLPRSEHTPRPELRTDAPQQARRTGPAAVVEPPVRSRTTTPTRTSQGSGPTASRTGTGAPASGGVVMTRPAVIVGAPAKPTSPPRVRRAREDEGRGFGQGLISEKSLDEVILAYLSEDSEDK